MNYLYFIGIDISKETLDIAVNQGRKFVLHFQITNNLKGLRNLLKQLMGLPDFSPENALFCMENTGIYNYNVLSFLPQLGTNICVEAPIHIKNSMGLQRGKNDKVDAMRIAQYAYKNREELRLWKPVREVVMQLKDLSTLRARLVNSKNQLGTPIKEFRTFNKKMSLQAFKLCKRSVEALEKDIKDTEKAMQEIIKSDPDLKRLFTIVTSVDGIGLVAGVQMIVTTGEFKTISEPKQYACYTGVAPFEHTSGTSIRGKNKVSHKANKNMKALLFMCAASAIRCQSDLKVYYERKLNEKKPKMLVINAIKNKLIFRVFACVKNNRLYTRNYDLALA